MITEANYIEKLLAQLPEFTDTYREHLADNFGEALGHFLFGELYRFTESAYQKSNVDVVTRVIHFINEAAVSESGYVQDMVQQSFLAYLKRGSSYEFIRSRLTEAALHMLALELDEIAYKSTES